MGDWAFGWIAAAERERDEAIRRAEAIEARLVEANADLWWAIFEPCSDDDSERVERIRARLASTDQVARAAAQTERR